MIRLLIALTALLIVLPKIAIECLIALYQQRRIALWSCEYAGKGLKKINHRTILIGTRSLADVDQWLHYLKGNIDLTGPTPIEFHQAQKMSSQDQARFNIAPGILSPYKVKQVSGIAYASEQEIALQFARSCTTSKRLMLIAIRGFQKLFRINAEHLKSPTAFTLFGVRISNIKMQTAVKNIMDRININDQPAYAATYAFVNADCANHYHNDEQYRKILNSFSEVFPDGIGVKIAARHQGVSLKENVNGTDMFPILCKQLNAKKKRIFLLGATTKVIKKTALKLAKQYPDIRIAGYIDGYSFNDNPEALCQHINQTNADLLMVAMGAPRQEQWISDNLHRLDVKAAVGVGGLFDFYSEQVSRAPEWLRELSMEWVWRLAAQPLDKGKRYLLGNPLFLMHVFLGNNQPSRKTVS